MDHTAQVYDIKHKTAAVLKRELEPDVDWRTFTQLATKRDNGFNKRPWGGVDAAQPKEQSPLYERGCVGGVGQKMLTVLDAPPTAQEFPFERALVQEKLGWVTRFRSQLEDWGELFEMIVVTESFVRHHGLYREVHLELEQSLLQLQAQTERTQRVRSELVAFVAEQAAKAHPDVGSSKVIESVLGKLKRLEQDQSKDGFTGLLLGLAAMVSTTTTAVIQKALETVPTKQVWVWCQETLGQTVQAKRREAFASLKRAEQKWDQSPEPT